jgi:Fe-S-cluster containining protein
LKRDRPRRTGMPGGASRRGGASAAGPSAGGDVPAEVAAIEARVAVETRRFSATLAKRNRERLRAVASAAFARLEAAVAADPPARPLACARGCSFCCHIYVSATAPELFLLAEGVRAWPEEKRRRFEDVLAAAADKVRDLPTRERAALSVPCPLLGPDGACSAYVHRPLACRAYGSFDRAACEQGHAMPAEPVPIPTPRVAMATRRLLAHSLRAALRERGMDGRSYELLAGLERILSTPDAEARWLAGEDVFAGVQSDPGGA